VRLHPSARLRPAACTRPGNCGILHARIRSPRARQRRTPWFRPADRSATETASASSTVNASGGNVRFRSRPYPPVRPGSAHNGTPPSRSAPRSRSTVRTLTSNRRASQAALRVRGETERSSSTRAYSRSVRFTPHQHKRSPSLYLTTGGPRPHSYGQHRALPDSRRPDRHRPPPPTQVKEFVRGAEPPLGAERTQPSGCVKLDWRPQPTAGPGRSAHSTSTHLRSGRAARRLGRGAPIGGYASLPI
jgi:hypothetical protein